MNPDKHLHHNAVMVLNGMHDMANKERSHGMVRLSNTSLRISHGPTFRMR